jgi:mannose-1-phosphate guanylyltransferase
MIGPRALVNAGVRIKDSIILDAVEIGNDSCVLNSVVGWESKIGRWARVEGKINIFERYGNNFFKGNPTDATHLNATYKGLKIPTATILGKDVVVADEICVRNCIVLPHKCLNDSYHNEVLM